MNKNIYEKLQIIQQKLKAPKNQYNKFAEFRYRSLEDIWEAVKPLLAEVGAYIITTDEIVMIGDRYYVKATAVLSDGAGKLETTAYAREPLNKKKMDDSQVTAATSSYARKYAMNGLLAIDDTKDPDSNKPPAAKPKDKQNEIVDMAFLNFEAKHQAVFTEPAMANFEFSREKFMQEIIKRSPSKALPTLKSSLKKIDEMDIKPEEVLVEKPSE